MRWTGNGIMDKKNGTILYSCNSKQNTFGVEFMVKRCIRNTIIGFELLARGYASLVYLENSTIA